MIFVKHRIFTFAIPFLERLDGSNFMDLSSHKERSVFAKLLRFSFIQSIFCKQSTSHSVDYAGHPHHLYLRKCLSVPKGLYLTSAKQEFLFRFASKQRLNWPNAPSAELSTLYKSIRLAGPGGFFRNFDFRHPVLIKSL